MQDLNLFPINNVRERAICRPSSELARTCVEVVSLFKQEGTAWPTKRAARRNWSVRGHNGGDLPSPEMVDRVFLAPLKSSIRCPYALNDGCIVRVLLSLISGGVAICVGFARVHFFDQFLRLAKSERISERRRRTVMGLHKTVRSLKFRIVGRAHGRDRLEKCEGMHAPSAKRVT